MRYGGSFLFAYAASSALLSGNDDSLSFPSFVSAKGGSRGRSRGGGFAGRRPTGGGFWPRPSPPRPSPPRPTPFRPTPSKPSSPTFGRPKTPTRPTFPSPTGPLSPTARSPFNPNPSFKPLSPTGAPQTRSGGGGWRSKAKHFAAGAAIGTVATVAAGYFFYGGRHSGPYCRGQDEARFGSGRCPRGTSSTAHACKSNIPLCPIPEGVRKNWNLGKDAPPNVNLAFDNSVCSVVALPAKTDESATDKANAPAPGATNATVPDAVTNSTATNSTVDGIVGQSGLDSCVRSIIASGGCDSYSAGNLFLYDEDAGKCGCCSSSQVTTIKSFASVVYSYSPADLKEAPKHCISGSTMYYPNASGGPDVTTKCECGACTTCGAGAPRNMDWSGPFVVPDAAGSISGGAKTQPEYDPVDTCLCNNATAGVCESQSAAPPPSAAAGVGAHSSNLVVLSSAIVFLLHFLKRG